jgi:hypothetical protein
MGRMLNPKKKKMLSHKQREELREHGISVNYDDRSDHIAIPIKNPCSGKEFFSIFETVVKGYQYEPTANEYQPVIEDPPIVEGPFRGFSQSVDNVMDDILKRIRSESSPGRCSDLWNEGDW